MRSTATIPAKEWAVAFRWPGEKIEYRRARSRRDVEKLNKRYLLEGMDSVMYRRDDDGKWRIYKR